MITTEASEHHDRRWLILPVLCLSVFLVVVDNTIVNVALPSLSRDLGASTTSLQWIVDAYSLAFAGLLLAGGGIGDRVGRKLVMQVGLIFFGIFSVLALKIGTRTVVGFGLAAMAAGLLVAGTNSTPSAPYFGPVLVSMILLALGLSFITAPATEAVMGSLRPEEVGAGAAVNNTTRELGGTLGVAVVGSVFASAYGPRILHSLAPYPVPSAAKTAASQSVAAALEVAGRAPATVAPILKSAALDAFTSGLRQGCFVAAGVAIVGAVVAVLLLPGRSEQVGEKIPSFG